MPLGDALNSLRLPDLWQQDAIRHLKAGRDVIVDAPTGAGKTLVFEALVDARALRGQAVYTVPTRALANDKRAEWTQRGWSVGIATGEVAENLHAPVVVATLETQRERLLAGHGPALMVVDEYQMLADPVRGLSYELALALAPADTQLLLLSGSVANAAEVQGWLRRLGRDCALVSTRERPVPLEEMPVESLPAKAPGHISGFWPRLAVEVLLADLGPLLIFAPRRSMAEKIARQIAAVLPADDPLVLTERQLHACGRELSAVLAKRVAWHHSGLGFHGRAGVVEPLAKAGRLRVVVATTGLAAGINFSMRSVVVAETRFFDGVHERELRRDELLQMFGRAGRRGLDATGWVVTTRSSPRPSDAAQVKLRRSAGVDWPPLLRVMHLAATRGESPLVAARRVADSLFTAEKVDLGLAPVAAPDAAGTEPVGSALFNLGPTRLEVLNSRGEWEMRDPSRLGSAPLTEACVVGAEGAVPALSTPNWLQHHASVGRVCRLAAPDRAGRELAVGVRAEGRRMVALTKQVRRWLGRRDVIASRDEVESEAFLAALAPNLDGGAPAGWVLRGETLCLQLDFAAKVVPVYRDAAGVPLVAAPERAAADGTSLTLVDPVAGNTWQPARGTAAHAWRRLGLIAPDGTPTRRGIIASFFHQGEGLAIAAGLEEATLPVGELVILLANLRAGARFAENLTGEADRLAFACREAFGVLDFEGSLSLGLPVGYGSGAAACVAEVLARPQARRELADDGVGQGDIERAVTEWLSLLRHVVHAPDHPWDRWAALKEAAAEHLQKAAPLLPSRALPEMPAVQLAHAVDHHLRPSMFRRP